MSLAILFALSPIGEAREEAPSRLESLLKEYKTRTVEALEPRKKLDAQYEAQLEKLKESALAEGNLALVLAARAEALAFRGRSGPKEKASEHKALERIQTIYAEQCAKLEQERKATLKATTAAYLEQLQKVIDGLTREGDLEGALAAEKEKKRSEEAIQFDFSPVIGRYVRVELPGSGTLSLAEVQVMSGGRNIAPEGKATQSSTHNHISNPVAKKAIDGNTDGDFSVESTTHTSEEHAPWWEVDLGEMKGMHGISVWNRTDVPDRLNGFKLSVLDGEREIRWQKSFPKAPAREVAVDLSAEPGE